MPGSESLLRHHSFHVWLSPDLNTIKSAPSRLNSRTFLLEFQRPVSTQVLSEIPPNLILRGKAFNSGSAPESGYWVRNRHHQLYSIWFEAHEARNGEIGLHLFVHSARPLKSVSKMPDREPIWRVVVSIALIVLLLGMTSGMLLHHHANCSTDTCPLCHLAISPSLAGANACDLVPIGAGLGHQYIRLTSRAALPRIPARAPPA